MIEGIRLANIIRIAELSDQFPDGAALLSAHRLLAEELHQGWSIRGHAGVLENLQIPRQLLVGFVRPRGLAER